MKRMSAVVSMTFVAAGLAAGAARAHQRDHLCVGDGRGCYAGLQAAVDAAGDGARISIGRGTFKGGVTIGKSLALIGAGAHATTIGGGGPVLTIGRFGAASEPTVSIAGATITGGRTRSSALSEQNFGDRDVLALGGGIEIPPAADLGDGATVTIRDSVITGNSVIPRSSVPSGMPCGSGCPFALAAGGGIDSWGSLTLVDSAVTDNVAGGPGTSDATAGGINSARGGLTLRRSVVARNRAVAVAPYGRFAEGGGMIVSSRPWFAGGDPRSTSLSIDDSAILDNRADLSAAFPADVEQIAQSGGLLITGDDDCTRQPDSGCVEATIRDSRVAGNSARATNSVGDAVAFGGGVNNDGLLTLRRSAIEDNHAAGRVRAGAASSAIVDSGGLGMGGAATIADSRLAGNSVTAIAPAGFALATAGGMSAGNPNLTSTLAGSLVAGNRATARGASVFLGGVGINNLGLLSLRRTRVERNAGEAAGEGSAHGGGILNTKFPDGPDAASLTLTGSSVTRNKLTGSDVAGAGIFNEQRLTVANSLIARNAPDQCVGC